MVDPKELARDTLLSFALSIHPKYETPWHIRAIAAKLEAIESRKIKRLMIFLPPRHGKSMLTNEIFPAWYLGKNPGHQVITTSYSQEVASGFGRKVRNMMAEPIYGEIFPNTRPKDDSFAAHRFDITNGGVYYAVGAGGPLTSRGANCIIIDDIHKGRAEFSSEVLPSRIKEWFGPVLYTRLAPNGVVVLIQTRWHMSDLPGHLLDSQVGEWDVLSLPAISETGAALWPERFPLEALSEIRRTIGTRDFTALYQQRPSPEEGEVVKRNWWRYWSTLPEFDLMVQSWDLTFKDSEMSDYVVCTVWGRKGADKYLVDMSRKKMSFTQTLSEFESMAKRWPKAGAKLVEEAANGAALIDSLRRKIPGIIPVRPKSSKLLRGQSVSPQIESGNVYIPQPTVCPWVEDFIEEWAQFPTGRYDDIVDSTTQALSRMAEMSVTNWTPVSVLGQSKWLR